MPTKVKRTLLVTNKDDAKTYLNADGVSLGITSFGNYILARLYMNGGKNGYAILNDTSKAILYPNDKAHPVEADVNFFSSVLTNNKSCFVGLLFDDVQVASEVPSSNGTRTDVKSLKDEAILQSSKNSVIRFHLHANNTVNAVTLQEINLSLYFMQYACAAKSVSSTVTATVDKTEAYDGDIVTFTATVADGEIFEGWYSDISCTNLVSTDQNYSVSPTSDLILYAKDTQAVELFTCAAAAGAKISSVNVSDSTIPANGSCTFSATVNTGCTFDGWYSDESCTNLVSTENPYTATITADTTLYAKAHISIFNISVEQAEYGTASASISTAQYGDNVTFTATPSSQKYDFFGWYADAAYTNLVSLDNPYNCTVTTDIKLYPKFGLRNYNLIVHPTGYDKINFSGATNIENVEILYKNSSKETSTDTVATWAIGELNKSDNPASVGFFVDGIKFSSIPANATITGINVSMKAKSDGNTNASIVCNTSRGFYTAKKEINGDSFSYVQIGTTTYKDAVIKSNEDSTYTYYLTYTISNEEAGEWTVADLKSGYFGIIWLASSPSMTNNNGVCKHLIHNIDISISYTLPDESTTPTTLYFRTNGVYKSVTRVYKKVSNTWVEQTNLPAIFSGISNGTVSNYVYGGSV